MPLFDMVCSCGNEFEVLIRAEESVTCRCGNAMAKKPAFPAMVKIGHGYPSKRKERRGSAPYSGGATKQREIVTHHGAPYE